MKRMVLFAFLLIFFCGIGIDRPQDHSSAWPTRGLGPGPAEAGQDDDSQPGVGFRIRKLPPLPEASAVTRQLAEAVAADQPDPALIKKLLAEGADPNAEIDHGQNALILALENNAGLDLVRILLAAGADPNAAGLSRRGQTPLMLAALGNTNPEAVAFWLENGCRIDDRDRAEATALHLALTSGRTFKMASALLAAGADPRAADRDGDQPLHYAVASHAAFNEPQILSVLEALLKAGAQVDARNKLSETPLMLAVARHAHDGLTEFLLAAGADPNAADVNGDNILIALASQEDLSHFRTATEPLLAAGAQADWRNKKGETALHYASLNSDAFGYLPFDVLSTLIKAGADPNAADQDGATPLMWVAARRPDPEEVMLWLVENGARADAKSKDGRTLLDWAAQNPDPEALTTARRLLLPSGADT